MQIFSYGLSYTKFLYSNLTLNGNNKNNSLIIKPCQTVTVKVQLTNNGPFGKYSTTNTADEIVMVYLQIANKTYPTDNLRLVNFTRVENVKNGETQLISIDISPYWMSVVEPFIFDQVIISGEYNVFVGGYLTFDKDSNSDRNYNTLIKQTFHINEQQTNVQSS